MLGRRKIQRRLMIVTRFCEHYKGKCRFGCVCGRTGSSKIKNKK